MIPENVFRFSQISLKTKAVRAKNNLSVFSLYYLLFRYYKFSIGTDTKLTCKNLVSFWFYWIFLKYSTFCKTVEIM